MREFCLETYLKKVQESVNIDDCPKVPIPEMEKGQNYIFISYSHKDYKEVYSDLAHLYCQGVRFWYDKGLEAGEDWECEVKEHIHSPYCCGVIFYLSTNMFLSESIFKEIGFVTEKTNILLQKNYFCVNLQNSNISDMLFEVQGIQRSMGIARMDTKKLNTLTATFSDDDTYIRYGSTYHIDELIEQIQRKFDVTSKADSKPSNVLALDSIKEPRLAWLVLNTRELDPIPLFRYLLADFKKTKKTRPWILFPVGIVLGMMAFLAATYLLGTIPEVPWLSAITEGKYALALILVGCLGILWTTAQVFWLFYISPVARNREKGLFARLIHFPWYLLMVLVFAIIAFLASVISCALAYALVSYLGQFLK